MRRLLLDNLALKALAVLIAFGLWVITAREPELATSFSVPILFRHIPEDLDISSNVPERVHLEVRGPARRLTPESLSQTAVVLDLAGLQQGERTFTIHESDVRQLPINVMFYRAVPSQVALRFERLSTKEVPVEPTYAKAPPQGYYVVRYGFEPARVRIRGPESRLQTVDHVTTDPIDLSGVISHAEKRAHVRLPDPQFRLESDPVVKFSVELERLPNKDIK